MTELAVAVLVFVLSAVAASGVVQAARRPLQDPAPPELERAGSTARLVLLRVAACLLVFVVLGGLAPLIEQPAIGPLAFGLTLAAAMALVGLVERGAVAVERHAGAVALAMLAGTVTLPLGVLQAAYATRAVRSGPQGGIEAVAGFSEVLGSAPAVLFVLTASLALLGVPFGLVTLDRLRPGLRDTGEVPAAFMLCLLAPLPGTALLDACYEVALRVERRLLGSRGPRPLLHILTRDEWEAARRAGRYAPPSLAAEGFIHLSAPAQLEGTARRFFAGRDDLLVLVLDAERFEPGVLRWAPPPPGHGDAPFPHLHRALQPGEVLEVRELPPPR